MKKILLLILLSSAAQATQLCKPHKVVGQRTLLKICADETSPGVLESPVLVDHLNINWPIAPGMNSESRASKICSLMGMGEAMDINVSSCSYEQATLNLRGNYAMQGLFMLSRCFSRVQCAAKK